MAVQRYAKIRDKAPLTYTNLLLFKILYTTESFISNNWQVHLHVTPKLSFPFINCVCFAPTCSERPRRRETTLSFPEKMQSPKICLYRYLAFLVCCGYLLSGIPTITSNCPMFISWYKITIHLYLRWPDPIHLHARNIFVSRFLAGKIKQFLCVLTSLMTNLWNFFLRKRYFHIFNKPHVYKNMHNFEIRRWVISNLINIRALKCCICKFHDNQDHASRCAKWKMLCKCICVSSVSTAFWKKWQISRLECHTAKPEILNILSSTN